MPRQHADDGQRNRAHHNHRCGEGAVIRHQHQINHDNGNAESRAEVAEHIQRQAHFAVPAHGIAGGVRVSHEILLQFDATGQCIVLQVLPHAEHGIHLAGAGQFTADIHHRVLVLVQNRFADFGFFNSGDIGQAHLSALRRGKKHLAQVLWPGAIFRRNTKTNRHRLFFKRHVHRAYIHTGEESAQALRNGGGRNAGEHGFFTVDHNVVLGKTFGNRIINVDHILRGGEHFGFQLLRNLSQRVVIRAIQFRQNGGAHWRAWRVFHHLDVGARFISQFGQRLANRQRNINR